MKGMHFNRLISLIIKEFYSVWRDKKSRVLLFLPPIMQLFLFSHAATLDIENITAAILNEDSTPISREFLNRVSGSKYFKKIIYVKNLKELQSELDEENVRGAIYIKSDFTKKYLARQNPEVEVILDGRHTNGSQIIGNYIGEIAAGFNVLSLQAQQNASSKGLLNLSSRHTFSNNASQAELNNVSFGQSRLGGGSNVSLVVRNWYNPNLYYHWFIISSLVGILSMSMVLLLSALSLAREKESGTFDELLVTPLKPYEIVAGKLIIPLFFGFIDAILILLAAKFVFHLPMEGNILLYFFALIWFLVSISGVGLFISCFCKTQQQAMLLVFVFMFPAMILSGYNAPVENITPEFLQKLTIINPLRFFLVISKGIILKNINFYFVMLNLIPIILISIFTLFIANYSFKNRLE